MSTSPNDPKDSEHPFRNLLMLCREAMKQATRADSIASLRSSYPTEEATREACEKLLHQHYDEVEKAGYRDLLTTLYNRSYFEDQLTQQLDLLARYDISFAVGLIDLDGFKQINDQRGHAAGDQVLQDTATALTQTLRASDIITRYGGDEFAVILPHIDTTQLPLCLDRLRSAGEKNNPFSMGWVIVNSPHAKTNEIVAKADQALYKAKQMGRHAWSILPLQTEK